MDVLPHTLNLRLCAAGSIYAPRIAYMEPSGGAAGKTVCLTMLPPAGAQNPNKPSPSIAIRFWILEKTPQAWYQHVFFHDHWHWPSLCMAEEREDFKIEVLGSSGVVWPVKNVPETLRFKAMFIGAGGVGKYVYFENTCDIKTKCSPDY